MAPPFEAVCSPETLNINPILLVNIQHSPYYQVLLESIATFNDLLPELYKTTLAAPFFKGTQASSFFCILYRLGQMSPTARQIQGLLESTRRPYAQALGALYIRYVCAPKFLWSWLSPLLLVSKDRSETAKIKVDPRDFSPDGGIPLSDWVRDLLFNTKYYGTMLPRVPIPIEKAMKENLREFDLIVKEKGEEMDAEAVRSIGLVDNHHESEKELEEELEEGETRSLSSHSHTHSRSRSRSRSQSRSGSRSTHGSYAMSKRDHDRHRTSYSSRHDRGHDHSHRHDRGQWSRPHVRRRSRSRSRSLSRSRSRSRSRSPGVDAFGRDMPRDEYKSRDRERARDRDRDRHDRKNNSRSKSR